MEADLDNAIKSALPLGMDYVMIIRVSDQECLVLSRMDDQGVHGLLTHVRKMIEQKG